MVQILLLFCQYLSWRWQMFHNFTKFPNFTHKQGKFSPIIPIIAWTLMPTWPWLNINPLPRFSQGPRTSDTRGGGGGRKHEVSGSQKITSWYTLGVPFSAEWYLLVYLEGAFKVKIPKLCL